MSCFYRQVRVARASATAVLLLLAVPSPLVSQGRRPPPADVAIRSLDKITLTSGNVILGEVLTPGQPLLQPSIQVRRGSAVITLKRQDLAEVVPRRDAGKAYENWLHWMRQNLQQAAEVATAEFELALWCRAPHPELDGKPPRPDKVLFHLERVVRRQPDLVAAYPYLISEYARKNHFLTTPLRELDREIETYHLAIENGYRNPDIDFRIGSVLLDRLGLTSHAVTYLEAALAADDGNQGRLRQARSRLADAYVRVGRHGDALKLYEELISPDDQAPENFGSFYELGRLRARMGGSENRRLARAYLLRASELQPAFVDILLDLAALDYADGDLKSAEGHIRSYLSARPGDNEAKVDLALVLLRQGRLSQTKGILEKLPVQDFPKETSGAEKKSEDGEKTLGGAAAPSTRSLLARGSLAEQLGKPQEAVRHYRSALELDPSSLLPRLLLAGALIEGQGHVEAQSLIEEVQQKMAENTRVFATCERLLAQIDIARGQDSSAAGHLEHAVEVEVEDPALLEQAGIALVRGDQTARGLEYLRRAETLEPERPVTLAGLGYSSYVKKNLEDASAYFDRALSQMKGSKTGETRPEKDYCLRARALLTDVETLEVWADEFDGPDNPQIDGWEKQDLHGIVERAASRVVLRSRQDAKAGETGVRLMHSISSRDLERLTVRVRLDSGRVSPSLRLEAVPTSRVTAAALGIYRDFDGAVKVRWKASRDRWEIPAPDKKGVLGRALVYPGGIVWPDDKEYHRLEIRSVGARSTLRGRRSPEFEVYFDGRMVAKNVVVPGLDTPEYRVGVFAVTDAPGTTYAVSADDFRLYRQRRAKR